MKKTFLVSILCLLMLINTSSLAVVKGTDKTIKLNSKVSDELKSFDEVDYFNFKLTKPGSIKINFDFDIQGEYIVKFIKNDTNEVIQKLAFKSQVNTSSGRYQMAGSKVRVEKGKYTIEVSSNRNNHTDEEYKLKINYDSESSDRYEKESNDTAKESMIIDYNTEIVGNLESKSDVDFYMIDLERPGTIELELAYDRLNQYNIILYSEINGKLNQIQANKYSSGVSTGYGVSDKIRVPAGNYYIKVSGASNTSDEDYSLKVIYSADRYGWYEEEPNNEMATATAIYHSEKFTGNLSSKSDIDFYYMNLWGDTYYINMEIPEGASYNLIIYKEENGKQKQVASYKVEKNEYIKLEKLEGVYYIKITAKTYSNDDYAIAILTESEIHIPKTIKLEANNQYMTVNGTKVAIDGDRGTKPLIINGRMLLPVGAIIENLGGKVTWNSELQVATFELKDKIITMPIGSATAYVNGIPKALDVSTQTINSRTMAPVRFIAENLGCQVVWDNGVVTIDYK